MDGYSEIAHAAGEAAQPQGGENKPCLVIREGRGRLGGTMFLDLLIQRAREAGRRVIPLDGDLKSRTLSSTYPAVSLDGAPIVDGASTPPSDDIVALKDWIQGHLNQMTEDNASRVLDLSGGDRVIQELVLDLRLRSFCHDFGVGLTNVVMLGPDIEDFHHAMERINSEDSRGDRVILVLNEGVKGLLGGPGCTEPERSAGGGSWGGRSLRGGEGAKPLGAPLGRVRGGRIGGPVHSRSARCVIAAVGGLPRWADGAVIEAGGRGGCRKPGQGEGDGLTRMRPGLLARLAESWPVARRQGAARAKAA